MVEREGQPEQQEYNFEGGISEAVHRILEISKTQKYMAIAIIGSGADVGKTTVANQIIHQLKERGMNTAWQSNIGGMSYKPIFSGPAEEGGVLVLHAESAPLLGGVSAQDEQLRTKSKQFGLPFSKVDLRIFVYRPDLPFHPEITRSADIIIRNEQAKNKAAKYIS